MFGAAVVRLEYIASWSLLCGGRAFGRLVRRAAAAALTRPFVPGGSTLRKPPIVVGPVRLRPRRSPPGAASSSVATTAASHVGSERTHLSSWPHQARRAPYYAGTAASRCCAAARAAASSVARLLNARPGAPGRRRAARRTRVELAQVARRRAPRPGARRRARSPSRARRGSPRGVGSCVAYAQQLGEQPRVPERAAGQQHRVGARSARTRRGRSAAVCRPPEISTGTGSSSTSSRASS